MPKNKGENSVFLKAVKKSLSILLWYKNLEFDNLDRVIFYLKKTLCLTNQK